MTPRTGSPCCATWRDETAQTIGVRRRGELLDELALLGEQADVKPLATEIKSSVQHQTLPSERLTGTAEQPVTVRRGRRLLFEWPARAAGIRARLHRCSTQSADPLRPHTTEASGTGLFHRIPRRRRRLPGDAARQKSVAPEEKTARTTIRDRGLHRACS